MPHFKALNDTMGINWLNPIFLVYGVHPKLPLPNLNLKVLPQSDRMLDMNLDRDE